MAGRGGLGLALFAAVLAALIFTQAAKSVADQLEGHITSRSADFEVRHSFKIIEGTQHNHG